MSSVHNLKIRKSWLNADIFLKKLAYNKMTGGPGNGAWTRRGGEEVGMQKQKNGPSQEMMPIHTADRQGTVAMQSRIYRQAKTL